MEKNYMYDEYSDSLLVSNEQENGLVKENFEIGEMIFSLTEKGKIAGIEIRGFSRFLEMGGINPEILKDIEYVNFKIVPRKDAIFILLKIHQKQGNEIIIYKDIPEKPILKI